MTTQVEMQTYIIVTLGELALINYIVDNAKIGYNDVYIVAGIVNSLPQGITPNTFDQKVRYNLSGIQLAWIKKELARNLETINIPARFAVQCILLTQNQLEEEVAEQQEQNQDIQGEEMEDE